MRTMFAMSLHRMSVCRKFIATISSSVQFSPLPFALVQVDLYQSRWLSTKKSSYVSKVPDRPITNYVPLNLLPEVPEIDLALIEQLERMSLVEFADEKGLEELRNAVKSANQLLLVDTKGVEPLDSVLEDRPLWLREDQVNEGNCAEDILSNATKVEEQYFVAPPGNIPLKKKQREHLDSFSEKDLNLSKDKTDS